jgi:hypothetical protein
MAGGTAPAHFLGLALHVGPRSGNSRVKCAAFFFGASRPRAALAPGRARAGKHRRSAAVSLIYTTQVNMSGMPLRCRNSRL